VERKQGRIINEAVKCINELLILKNFHQVLLDISMDVLNLKIRFDLFVIIIITQDT